MKENFRTANFLALYFLANSSCSQILKSQKLNALTNDVFHDK
jgi:hypothetical protein